MNPTLSNASSHNRANVETMLPLTPTQQGLLFHTLKAPESGVYYEQVTCKFHTNLEVDSYRRALDTVISRHGVLRTGFLWDGPSKPIQVVFRRVELPWVEEDYRNLNSQDQQARLADYKEKDKKPGFNLSNAPLMRCALFRTGENLYEFVWSYHHLLLDGWSVQIVLGETLLCYNAYLHGKIPELPPIQPYSEFLRWISAQDASSSELFWRSKLSDIQSATLLPFPKNKKPNSKHGHSMIERVLDGNTSEKIQKLARLCEVTQSSIVQAAWALLLSRTTNQKDITFGVTVSGRPPSLYGVEQMVGLFVNALPICISIDNSLTLIEWLKKIHQQYVESEEYSYTPLHSLPGLSGLAPGTPLFESLVVFENYPVNSEANRYQEQLGISDILVTEQTNYPLTVVAIPGEHFRLRLHFDIQYIEKKDASNLSKMFSTILEQFLEEGPNLLIQSVALLKEQNELQQIALLNTALRDVEGQEAVCLHQRFESVVCSSPNTVAVRYKEKSVTYKELDNLANNLAHYLSKLGVSIGVPVALALERGIDSIIAILAVLKAGAFYIPLDLDHPSERLAWVLEDIKANFLVCKKESCKEFPYYKGTLITVEEGSKASNGGNSISLPDNIKPTNLCYVIYTSGSTGQPKGVYVEHRNVDHLLSVTSHTYNIGPSDVWTQFHSYAFDFSVWEIWGALLYGGQLEIVPHALSRNPKEFLSLLECSKVTMLSQTPTAFRQLLNSSELSHQPLPQSLRYVFFGGEATIPIHFAKYLTGKEHFSLVNLYGITETTVHATEHLLSPIDLQLPHSPIGRPIPGYSVYLLDTGGHPVPPGVPAEIYIGGKGVTRGYHNREELNLARFIENPFVPGEKLYRSGDIGRSDETGRLYYLGRIDDQVKIRGFRIELGEVESAIVKHHMVDQAVVLVDKTTHLQHARLVGFIVKSNPKDNLDMAKLRSWLTKSLPNHAIPSAFITVDKIPLTTNGKLDRSTLFNTLESDEETESPQVLPRNSIEKSLKEIFESVLNRKSVSITDNFFELGGDSILSIQILSAAHKVGIDFSLEDLMQALTIEQLSPKVKVLSKEAISLEVPSTQEPASNNPENNQYPLSAMQMAMIANEMRHEQNSAYHNVNGQRFSLEFNVSVLESVLKGALERHPVLRTSFDLAADIEPLQLVHNSVSLPLKVYDWRMLNEEQQNKRIIDWRKSEHETRFDITCPPLIRFTVHRLTNKVMHIGVTKHHAILDGWSFNLLLSELISDYIQRLAGYTSKITAPVSHFWEFIKKEREAIASPVLKEWWDKKLSTLHVTRLAPDTDGADIAPRAVPISFSQSQALKDIAINAGTSVKSVLLAIHILALSRIIGADTITTGVVFNGRSESIDGDRVLGLFLNSLPVGIDLSEKGKDIVSIVQAVQKAEIETFARRRYPLIELHRRIGTVFDILFNFTHFHVLENTIRDIEVSDGYATDMTNVPLVVQTSLDGQKDALKMVLIPLRYHFSETTFTEFLSHYKDVINMFVGKTYSGTSEPTEKEMPGTTVLTKIKSKEEINNTEDHKLLGGSKLREELNNLWTSVLKKDIPSTTTSFGALGGDSLIMLRICSRAGRLLDLDSKVVSRMLTAHNIEEQACIIENNTKPKSDGKANSLVVLLSSSSKSTPLFFAPGAGGHIAYLSSLADALSNSFSLWGMRLPEPREINKTPYCIETIAEKLTKDICRIQPSGPYYLGGHSFGGQVAYEIGRQLIEQGKPVEWVAVVDSTPPYFKSGEVANKHGWSSDKWMAEIGNSFIKLVGSELKFVSEEFDAPDEEQQISKLYQRLITAEVLPIEFSLSEFSARVRAFIAHSLIEYKPTSLYSGKLFVFLATQTTDDSTVSKLDFNVMQKEWNASSSDKVIITQLPGDHFSIMRYPFVNKLASALTRIELDNSNPS